MPRGRKPKLTLDVQEKLIQAFKVGATMSVAAKFVGIRRETLGRWLQRGAGECARDPYREFALRAGEATGSLAVLLLATIDQAALKGDWKAAAWKLAHMGLEDYAYVKNKPSEDPAAGGASPAATKVEASA